MSLIKCSNCGNSNTAESNFCRFCGTRFVGPPAYQPQPYQQPRPPQQTDPFNYAAPEPYSWKTDEFKTQGEARKTSNFPASRPQPGMMPGHAPLGFAQPMHLSQPYRCPVCSSQFLPRIERKISTAGWVTFALLLVFIFPLFWIGLLIKEDHRFCPSCNSRVG